MKVAGLRTLVVHADKGIASIWAGFLRREGLEPHLAHSEADAVEALRREHLHALVLDIETPGALGVADFAAYRCPDLPVIPVSSRTFFSESAIFQIMPNARSVMRAPVNPSDMAAVAGHYARRYRERAAAG